MSENIEHSEFKTFLSKVDLHEKCCNFLTNGITRIEHLQDIKEDDIGQLNLTVFEWRRLQREVTAWKSKVSTKETAADKPGFKTSSASEIIALPKAFRDSFHTRDGKGHIVVSVEQLKRKFKNLWYELPLNPSQVFSNSVILKMAQERMQHEKSLRACEMWCRAQRKKRTVVMLAAAQKPVISKWTHYFKSQSIVGLCEIADVQYPAVVDFMKIKKDKSCIPPKALYEMFGLYLVLLEEASAFSDDALGKCNQYVTDCLIGGGETPKRGTKICISKSLTIHEQNKLWLNIHHNYQLQKITQNGLDNLDLNNPNHNQQ